MKAVCFIKFDIAETYQVVVVQVFNFSTWDAEAGGLLSLRSAWSIE